MPNNSGSRRKPAGIKAAIVQAEDELAAIGIVIGASWNGARAFTATSGPGISLMAEFLGLAYFAEIPAVLIDVQRAGPSTGMPTRTQQSDLLACAYASHGDTKNPPLLPCDPKECFEMTADAFDLAERLQTPVIVMSDLDLGMNDHLSPPLAWDDERTYDRGKVLDAEATRRPDHRHGAAISMSTATASVSAPIPEPIPTRVPISPAAPPATSIPPIPKTAPPTSTQHGAPAAEMGDRQRVCCPWPGSPSTTPTADWPIVFYGTTSPRRLRGHRQLAATGAAHQQHALRAFPFQQEVMDFIDQHELVFVIEQNRDGQMRTLLINELNLAAAETGGHRQL
jgi:2-oxoglutarate/2-oxoacid ferredoxin oxidoreductase subunit alpha